MPSRLFRILIILAGVMGADGVILAAASAHQGDAARLAPASSMLLFHATAVLAVVALSERGVIHAGIGLSDAFGGLSVPVLDLVIVIHGHLALAVAGCRCIILFRVFPRISLHKSPTMPSLWGTL